MKYSKIAWGFVALAAGLGLGACGGSGGGGSTAAGSTSTTVGVISGFGSVYVNGCEYETDSASISVDGQNGSEDDLSVGDVVEITGPVNCTKAEATSIKYADELEGVVDSSTVSGGVGTMVVMGQNLTINELTVYEDYTGSVATINDVTTGHVIEVSGFGIGKGDIVATRIEVKALTLANYLLTHDDIEVKGVVTSHNGTDEFNIGNLVVNYGSAILDDISTITNDLYVEVKATSYTAGSMNLVATKVELEDDGEIGHQGDDDDEFEIKGMLTAAYDSNSKTFGINDQMITVNDNTEYEDVQLADLSAGNIGILNLEAEGQFTANGVFVAEEVELEDDISDNNECKGTVSNLVPQAGENNMGTLTVNATSTAECEGQTSMAVTVTNDTIMYDDDDIAPVAKFNLTHLRDGDLVEVYVDPTTGIAIKLERE